MKIKGRFSIDPKTGKTTYDLGNKYDGIALVLTLTYFWNRGGIYPNIHNADKLVKNDFLVPHENGYKISEVGKNLLRILKRYGVTLSLDVGLPRNFNTNTAIMLACFDNENKSVLYPPLDLFNSTRNKAKHLLRMGLLSFHNDEEHKCEISEQGTNYLHSLQKFRDFSQKSGLEVPSFKSLKEIYEIPDAEDLGRGAILAYVKTENDKRKHPTALDIFYHLVPSAQDTMNRPLDELYRRIKYYYVDPSVKDGFLLMHGSTRQMKRSSDNRVAGLRKIRTLKVSTTGKHFLQHLKRLNEGKLPTLEEVFVISREEIISR